VFCPVCNGKGQAQPIMCAMDVTGAEGGKWCLYRCSRCGYTETHPQRLDGNLTWRSGGARP
jgi:hypothetical protein